MSDYISTNSGIHHQFRSNAGKDGSAKPSLSIDCRKINQAGPYDSYLASCSFTSYVILLHVSIVIVKDTYFSISDGIRKAA